MEDVTLHPFNQIAELYRVYAIIVTSNLNFFEEELVKHPSGITVQRLNGVKAILDFCTGGWGGSLSWKQIFFTKPDVDNIHNYFFSTTL